MCAYYTDLRINRTICRQTNSRSVN